MRKRGFLLLAASAILLLTGCPVFFDFNLFKPLDLVPLPTGEQLNSMSNEEALAYLSRELGSPRFVEKLRADAEARGAVEDYLEGITSIPPMGSKGLTIEELVDWYWLTAKYYLCVYFGEDMVNNVANLIVGAIDSATFATEEDAQAFITDFLERMVPPDALETQGQFYTMLEGFRRSWDAYEWIALNFFDGDPETPVPANFNMGDYVQYALFSWLIDTALTPDAIWATTDAAKAALWQIVQPEEPTQPLGTGAAFQNPFEPGHPIYNIMGELGILDLFDM